MQKQKKQLIAFLILLVICVGAYVGVRIYNSKAAEKEAADSEKEKVAEIATDDVTAFSYNYNGVEYAYTKTDNTWTYDGDASLSLDQDTIATMLSNIESISVEDKMISDEYESASDYGFDEPTMVISVSTAEQDYTFTFGMNNSTLSQDYMMLDGDDTVYLVSTSVQSAFEKTVDDLIAAEDTEDTESITEATESAVVDSTETE